MTERAIHQDQKQALKVKDVALRVPNVTRIGRNLNRRLPLRFLLSFFAGGLACERKITWDTQQKQGDGAIDLTSGAAKVVGSRSPTLDICGPAESIHGPGREPSWDRGICLWPSGAPGAPNKKTKFRGWRSTPTPVMRRVCLKKEKVSFRKERIASLISASPSRGGAQKGGLPAAQTCRTLSSSCKEEKQPIILQSCKIILQSCSSSAALMFRAPENPGTILPGASFRSLDPVPGTQQIQRACRFRSLFNTIGTR